VEAFVARHDTELLGGKALAAQAFNDDTVGRVLDRLSAAGTLKIVTAGAVRAAPVLGWDTRYGHCDTTCWRVYGDYLLAAEQEVPFIITPG
jgi:hypothetical protein